jgi:asparagine synthase (glutamine-hydrolysing)
LVSFSRDLQTQDPRLTAMKDSLNTPASPADAIYLWPTSAFVYQGVNVGYADGRHSRPADPDCMVVVDAALTDRALLERKLYGTRRPLAATAEVILDAYLQWGANLVDHLQGGFSMAIWDAILERLLLIRDPLGLKIIFFMNHADGLTFATQETALRAHPAFSASVEHEALHELTRLRLTRASSSGNFHTVQEVSPGEVVQALPI